MLASLCAHPRPGLSSAETAADRKRSRELFEKIVRLTSSSKIPSIKALGEDWQMHADIARLWQSDNLERAGKAYLEAARIEVKPSPSDPTIGVVDPRLSNNLGVIKHLESDLVAAQRCYQDAITVAASSPIENDGIITTVMYNLARVYEEQGDVSKAREAFDKLLGKHPEYVDGTLLHLYTFMCAVHLTIICALSKGCACAYVVLDESPGGRVPQHPRGPRVTAR